MKKKGKIGELWCWQEEKAQEKVGVGTEKAGVDRVEGTGAYFRRVCNAIFP